MGVTQISGRTSKEGCRIIVGWIGNNEVVVIRDDGMNVGVSGWLGKNEEVAVVGIRGADKQRLLTVPA